MRIVGLTGGIGSGKSTVSNLFKAHGIPVVDADIVARNVLKKDTSGWRKVVAAFGDEILLPNGEVDRPKLGQIVFNNSDMRQLLNRVMKIHEKRLAIGQIGYVIIGIIVGDSNDGYASMITYMLFYISMNLGTFACIVLFGLRTGTENIRDYAGLYMSSEFLNRLLAPHISSGIFLEVFKLWLRGCKIIVLDVPLLFEAKMDKWANPIIVVWVDPETQLQRLTGRDGTTVEEASSRIGSQMSLDLKKTKAGIVIDNTGSINRLNDNFREVLMQVKRPLTWTEFALSRDGAIVAFVSILFGVIVCRKAFKAY